MNARKRNGRSAFTLLELLVAMAISLVMLYAMILFLRYVGDTVTDGRSMIEISGQLRAVRQRLHEDLASLTVPVIPLADVGGAPGYFMYYEGPRSDINRDGDPSIGGDGMVDATNTSLGMSPWGDFDDVIAFTIHSKNEPLVGREPSGNMVTADAAEVIWFCGWVDSPLGTPGVWEENEMRYLFRRQLLIAPDRITAQSLPNAAAARSAVQNAWQSHDISVRTEIVYNSAGSVTGYVLKGNTLADLSRRENRFGMDATSGFPFAFGVDPNSIFLGQNQGFEMPILPPPATPPTTFACPYVLQNGRRGEDIQLSRCIAWDVRVYDATAPVVEGPIDAAGPSDRVAVGSGTGSFGAFVDLWYSRPAAGNSLFSRAPNLRSQLGNNAIYDTWSSTYERDGINQDGDMIVDEGTNGYDDDGTGGVDDVGERETEPPYSTPLRGIQVMIRIFDPSTKQMRQATVVSDFMPE